MNKTFFMCFFFSLFLVTGFRTQTAVAQSNPQRLGMEDKAEYSSFVGKWQLDPEKVQDSRISRFPLFTQNTSLTVLDESRVYVVTNTDTLRFGYNLISETKFRVRGSGVDEYLDYRFTDESKFVISYGGVDYAYLLRIKTED